MSDKTGPNDTAPRAPRKRWFQFSLRAMVLLFLAVAVACGLIATRSADYVHDMEVLQLVEELGGECELRSDPPSEPSGWDAFLRDLRKRCGVGRLDERVWVVNLNRAGVQKTDLELIVGCKRLRALRLENTNLSNEMLAVIADAKSLKELDLTGNTELTDEGLAPLFDHPKLQNVLMLGTRVSPKMHRDFLNSLPPQYYYAPIEDRVRARFFREVHRFRKSIQDDAKETGQRFVMSLADLAPNDLEFALQVFEEFESGDNDLDPLGVELSEHQLTDRLLRRLEQLPRTVAPEMLDLQSGSYDEKAYEWIVKLSPTSLRITGSHLTVRPPQFVHDLLNHDWPTAKAADIRLRFPSRQLLPDEIDDEKQRAYWVRLTAVNFPEATNISVDDVNAMLDLPNLKYLRIPKASLAADDMRRILHRDGRKRLVRLVLPSQLISMREEILDSGLAKELWFQRDIELAKTWTGLSSELHERLRAMVFEGMYDYDPFDPFPLEQGWREFENSDDPARLRDYLMNGKYDSALVVAHRQLAVARKFVKDTPFQLEDQEEVPSIIQSLRSGKAGSFLLRSGAMDWVELLQLASGSEANQKIRREVFLVPEGNVTTFDSTPLFNPWEMIGILAPPGKVLTKLRADHNELETMYREHGPIFRSQYGILKLPDNTRIAFISQQSLPVTVETTNSPLEADANK